MVEIVMHNLSGLYMGPIVQIAASLVFPCNDNQKLSPQMENALRLMNSVIDKKPEVLNNPSLQELSGLMEEVAAFEAEKLDELEKKPKTSDFLRLVSSDETDN